MAGRFFYLQMLDGNGDPVSGALLNSYLVNTTTRSALYTDKALTTPATNPVVADSLGILSGYLDTTIDYTWTVTTADGATTLLQGDVSEGILTTESGDSIVLGAPSGFFLVDDEFGADPSGTDDSTNAIQAACAAAQAAGGGIIWFTPGATYKIYPDASDTAALGTFSNTRGLNLAFNGCKFTIARAFTSGQVVTAFLFDGSTNANRFVTIGDFEVLCAQVDSMVDAVDRGIQFLYFSAQNEYVTIGAVRQTGGVVCLALARGAGVSNTKMCKHFRIKMLDLYSVGYAFSCQNTGVDIQWDLIKCDIIGRPMIAYGCDSLKGRFDLRDVYLQIAIQALGTDHAGYIDSSSAIVRDVHLHINARPPVTLSASCNIAFQYLGTSGQTFRDIQIHFDYELGGGSQETPLTFSKLTAAGAIDTTASRGHIFDDLTVSGHITGVGASAVIFTFFSDGALVGRNLGNFTGETVRNFKIKDLTVTGSASSYCIGNFDAIVGGPEIENFVFPGIQMWNGRRDQVEDVRPNALVNGAVTVASLGTTFDSTTTPINSDDTYLFPGILLLSDGNDIIDVSQRTSTTPTGSFAALKWDIETANKKCGFLFPIEQKDSVGLLGQVCVASFMARKGGSNATVDTLRAMLVTWSSIADAITSDIVSAWSAEGTDPTLVANWTKENTPVNLPLSTSYVTYSFNANMDTASGKNVALFIWIDNSDGTVADIVYTAEHKLEPGYFPTPYPPAHYVLEKRRCDRLLRKLTVFVPQTVAQNLATIDMRATPTITGGGAGFNSTNTNAEILVAVQTTQAAQTLTLDASL